MAGGTVHETQTASDPSSRAGPIHEAATASAPASKAGPVHESQTDFIKPGHPTAVHQTVSVIAIQPPGPVHETVSEFVKGGHASEVHQAQSIDAAGQPPIIEAASVVQRDTARSFLTDVGVVVYHPPGGDVQFLSVEWQIGGTSGAWSPATAQPYDRRHDAGFQMVASMSPGTPINYVWQPFFDLPPEEVFDDVFVRIVVENNPTATVIVGPVTISTTSPSTAEDNFDKSLARRGQLARTPLDFLGCGLVIPFERGSLDFRNACEVELIKSSVRQILGTRAAVGNFLGDLPWRPDFGSKLWILRHRNNDPTLQGQAVAFVMEAMQWEPRIRVTSVELLRGIPTDEELRKLRVLVRYRIIEENVDENRVLLPEFTEEVALV